MEKMRPELQKMTKITENNEEVNAYQELRALMERMGKPVEKKNRRSILKPRAKQQDEEFDSVIFREFMRKNKDRDVSSLEKMGALFQKGTSKTGVPLIWLIPRLLTIKDDVLLLYYTLKLLEGIFKKPYSVVVDSTLWGPTNEIPVSLLIKLMQLLPNGAKNNMQNVYVLNPNAYFKQATKPILRK